MLRMLAVAALLVASPAAAQTTTSAQDAPPALAQHSGIPANFQTQFAHCYARANGVRLHYVIGGPVDGPLVVFLHEWPQTCYTWRNVMPALAKAHYHVVAVDYRGAGNSEKPQGGYDKSDYGRRHPGVVQQLGASKVNLVGRDIGVMVAHAYAAQWPGEVKTLTMLDVPIPATPAWNGPSTNPTLPDLWATRHPRRPESPSPDAATACSSSPWLVDTSTPPKACASGEHPPSLNPGPGGHF